MISVAHNLQSSVFRAPTAREALAAARASLGDDAVVLSTRTIPSVLGGGGSVEVVARAAHAAQSAAVMNAALRTQMPAPAPKAPAKPAAPTTPAAAAARYRSTATAPATPPPSSASSWASALSSSLSSSGGNEFAGLGSLGGGSFGASPGATAAHGGGPVPGSASFIEGGYDSFSPTRTVAGRGAWKNAADPPWTRRGGRTVGVFVGPTGAGKTTTLVKVAARAVMQGGLRPLLVTFDIWRAGAVAQLESYGRALGLETVVVESPRDMRRVLERDEQMILVDTAGRSPKDITALERQSTYASALGLHRAHLVLPATFSEAAIQNAVGIYSCFPIEDVIVSKIDEAGGHDDIERVGRTARMPVCAATNGQNIVEDILPGAMSSGYAGSAAGTQGFEEDR
jgi:flagellar biosynthesis GTPase FlhF